MYPELLQHIERLQVELATVDPRGQTAAVAVAVARIAAGLRETSSDDAADGLHALPTNGTNRPVFMQ